MTELRDEEGRGLYAAPFMVERPEKVSQTMMHRLDVCPYSAALYLKYRRENVQSHRMAGGEMLHAVLEQLTTDVMNGDELPPPEVAKDLAQAMMQERVDLALTADEQEGVRTGVWNWATAFVPDPETIVGVEIMLEMELDGWIIRGKLDLLELVERLMVVTDYKSSLRLPTVEEFARNFQGQFYALLALEGVVEGTTQAIGAGVPEAETRQVFPRYRPIEEGGHLSLVKRWATYDRQQLFDFKIVLSGHLKKLERGLQTNHWAAATGPHCGTCPARDECPIPPSRRPKVIESGDEASTLAEGMTVRARELKKDRAALVEHVSENGPLDTGGVVWDFEYTEKEIADKEAIKAFIEEHGGDVGDFYRKQQSTTLKAKTREAWNE